jgi:V8-like Glu-specific endopeptidase
VNVKKEKDMKRILLFAVAFATAGMMMFNITVSLGSAQTSDVAAGVKFHNETETQAEIEAYWTPERLLSAQTIELHPEVDARGLPIVSEVATQPGQSVFVDGAEASFKLGNSAQRILIPANLLPTVEPADGIQKDATSSFGAYFTTSRVFPDAATTAGPNKTIGKLFFTDPRTGTNFVCSASVLRFRLVVTAGHCVAHGSPTPSDQYFYSKFMFVPSELSGAAPNGTWTPSGELVTSNWVGSGSVPNEQDVGMLIIKDQKINGNGPYRIGHITGYLGYAYCNGTDCSNPPISDNALTILGYPCNLDSCERMELTSAQTYESGGSNTWIYGSAFRGGASGGPWIQDYGVNPSGAPAGLLGNNYVEAVTSYGPTSTTPMYLGASAWDNRFKNMLTSACGIAPAGSC